jgi:disulfide bond formation protein DsbB
MLGIAAFKNDKGVLRYSLPLVVIGWSISVWHILEQKVPGFAEILPCSTDIPCSIDYLSWSFAPWVTIPMLSCTAFILIFVFLMFSRDKKSRI